MAQVRMPAEPTVKDQLQKPDACRANTVGEIYLKADAGQTQEKVGSGQQYRAVENRISFFHVLTPALFISKAGQQNA